MTKAMQNADAVYAMNPPAHTVTDMFTLAREIGDRYVAAIKHSGVGGSSSASSRSCPASGIEKPAVAKLAFDFNPSTKP
jgi:hypothetical protein